MSSKINVIEIVRGHIGTLRGVSGKPSIYDYFTFFFLPITLSAIGAFVSFKLSKDTISLLVNFGAIFTALLLSVLVLVYEQETKIDKAEKQELYRAKKQLLEDLYYNICFSIIASITLVFNCFLLSILDTKTISLSTNSFSINLDLSIYLLTPLAVFIISNLLLTIIMIVKRMHTLLTY